MDTGRKQRLKLEGLNINLIDVLHPGKTVKQHCCLSSWWSEFFAFSVLTTEYVF